MARGKIQIKKIENQTNRQVTYSKRRNGLFKKAKELAVLCDATVSIIMISASDRVHEFHSPTPGITVKQIYDRYQKAMKVDLWVKQYQKMQEELEKLNETNRSLQKDIRRRMGDCLEDMNFSELLSLGEDVDNSLRLIREHKYKKLVRQIDTTNKKMRNSRQVRRGLLQEFDISKEEPDYGLVDNGEYNPVFDYDDDPRMLSLRLQPCHPNLHAGAGSGSCITTYTLL